MEPKNTAIQLEIADVSDLLRLLDLTIGSLETVAPLLDDLNALAGADFDTGSNALHTFRTIRHLLRETPTGFDSAPAFLNACTIYARSSGRGHIGILIANLFESLAKSAHAQKLRPIDVRRFFKSLPATLEQCFKTPDLSLQAIAVAAAEVADNTEDPITSIHMMVGEASMEIQGTLIESTEGWINPGAAVLALFIASLHSLYDGHEGALEVALAMISSLAQTASRRPLPANQPREGAEYSVDLQLDGMVEDFQNYCASLDSLQVRYSKQGSTDLLGMGSWRFHIDTSTPLSVIPRFGWVRNIVVKDARYGELIGQDELAVQQEESGVLYLSRPTWQRPDTVRVIALVRHLEFLEEIASTGAWVVFNPSLEDTPVVASLLADAPGNTALLLPADEQALQIAQRAQKIVENRGNNLQVIYPTYPYSDVLTSVCAATAAPIFMPQVGERTPEVTRQLLQSAADGSVRRCALVNDTNPLVIKDQLNQLIGYGLSRLVLFCPENDQQLLQDTVNDALEERGQLGHYVEIIHSETTQIVLVNG